MPRKKVAPASGSADAIKLDAKKAETLKRNAAALVEYAVTARNIATHLGIKARFLEQFTLSLRLREVLLPVPGISDSIKARLAKKKESFTVAEVAHMTMALAEMPVEDDPRKQMAPLIVAEHLTERLQAEIAAIGEAKLQKAQKPKIRTDPNTDFQFKITLIGSKPPIWRLIQVADCTLDKLHEHIQTSMGWTNSHLHRFEIGRKQYADPMLMEEDMEEFGYIDSIRIKISKIFPKDGKKFTFKYEYDFGDCWEHEVLFEGCHTKTPGKKYPICLAGERACPPEDCGGLSGFYEFIKAIKNPKHKQHARMLEWSGDFDPERFDAGEATKAMKKGLPDWRNE